MCVIIKSQGGAKNLSVVQGKSWMVVCDLHGLTQDAKVLLFRASLLSICEGGICVLTINKLFVRASNSCRTMFKKYLWSTAKRKAFNAGVESRIENRYSPRILIEEKNSDQCLEIIITHELLNTETEQTGLGHFLKGWSDRNGESWQRSFTFSSEVK